MEAAGVNRPDILQRLGHYPPPPGVSDLPGLEVAGTIAAVGPDVERWHEGDSVCALVAGGGYAEYCVVPAPQALPLPRGMRPGEAAAIPETYFTVWTNLFQRGRLSEGESVLIHGGSSGIGTTAIQLARAFGATAYATAGSDAKCGACERLGAHAINYKRSDFVQVVQEATNGKGVDVVLDIVGGDYLQRNIDCLAMHGRLLQIGLLGSARAEVNLRPIMTKRLTITGSTLRTRSVEEKGAIARELEARVWPLLASRQVRPIIHQTLSFSEAAGSAPPARVWRSHRQGRSRAVRLDVGAMLTVSLSSARHVCALQIDEPGCRDTGRERRQRKPVARNGLMREHRPVKRLPRDDGGEHQRHAGQQTPLRASCPTTLLLLPPPRPQPRRGTAAPRRRRCRGARATTASMAARKRNRADAKVRALRTRAATSRGTSPKCMACAPRRGCKARQC